MNDVRTPCPPGLTFEEAFRWHMPGEPPAQGCWIWPLARDPRNGYGRLELRRNTINTVWSAHRLSYTIHHGPIPLGLVVRHLCHNPICVHPGHLAIGTHADNKQDAVMADRHARGTRSPRHKLNDEQVRLIRAERARGATQAALGEKYGVSRSAVKHIVSGRTWTHVD